VPSEVWDRDFDELDATWREGIHEGRSHVLQLLIGGLCLCI
jgi:hypothetical protein